MWVPRPGRQQRRVPGLSAQQGSSRSSSRCHGDSEPPHVAAVHSGRVCSGVGYECAQRHKNKLWCVGESDLQARVCPGWQPKQQADVIPVACGGVLRAVTTCGCHC